MKKKNFIRNYKIEKSLKNKRPYIKKGDLLDMFTCRYKVLNSDLTQVMLEDENGTTLSLPRNKVDFLIVKGRVRFVNEFDTYKSSLERTFGRVFKAKVSQPGVRGGKFHYSKTGEIVYGDPKGQSYHQAGEGVYRQAQTGKFHDAEGNPLDIKNLINEHPELKAKKEKMLDLIQDPALKSKAEPIVESFMESVFHSKFTGNVINKLKEVSEDKQHKDHSTHQKWALRAKQSHEDLKDIYKRQFSNLVKMSREK